MRLAVKVPRDRVHLVLAASSGPSLHVRHQLWVHHVEEALLARRHLRYIGHSIPVLLPESLVPGTLLHISPEVDIKCEALAIWR